MNENEYRPSEITTEELEQRFLGCLLLDSSQYEKVAHLVKGAYFRSAQHEFIFNAIATLIERGQNPDVILVSDYLMTTGELSRISQGVAYLHQLVALPSTAVLAPEYAEKIKQHFERRSLMLMLSTATESLGAGAAPESISGSLMAELDVLSSASSPHEPKPILDYVDETATLLKDGMFGVSTGFPDIDDRLGGFAPKTSGIIAGRPAMGKTVVAMSLALKTAEQGIPTLYVALEMSGVQMLTRVLSNLASISSTKLNPTRPDLTENDWSKIATAVEKMEKWPLYLVESSNMTVEEVLAHVRSFQRKHSRLMVFVDYIGLLTSAKKFSSRQEELSHISRSLKMAAMSNECATTMIQCSQLNRGSEQRADKRPMVSDLRESGSLEQDADWVCLLHREEVYDKESPRAGEIDLDFAKMRSSSPGVVTMAGQMHYYRISSMARDYQNASY